MVAVTIKKGYKQTELGIIPEDWDVKKLGGECELITKGTTPTSVGRDFQKSGINFIKIESLEKNGEIIKDKVAFIDSFTYSLFKRSQLKSKDILFSIAGALGRVAIVSDEILPANTNQALAIVRLNKTKALNINYVFYFLNSEKIQRHIESISVQGAQANLSLLNIYDLPVAFPKYQEQTAIATILSDTNALITHLEKLIAKKKAIKQGTMQHLLTGKKRLPGFSGEWEVKKLGEIATIVGGGTPSTYVPNYWNGTINWFTPTEIGLNKYTYSSLRKITKEGLKNCSARILPTGTVLLTTRAGIGDMSILMNEGCTNQGFQSLIANNDTSYEFLYYLVSTLKDVLIQNASGSTFLEISPNKIKQIDAKIPNLKEQNAIAAILSDMDADIESLEQKRDKYTMLKQGMMQQLLTGGIRIHAAN